MGITSYIIVNVATLAFTVFSMLFFKLEDDMRKKNLSVKDGNEDSVDDDLTADNNKPDVDEREIDSDKADADREAVAITNNEENETTENTTDVDDNKEAGPYNIVESVGIPFIMLMFVLNLALANVITYVYGNSPAINIKLMFVVCMLWPIAFIDYRTKMIPNYILKVMLVARVAFFIPEFIVLGDIPHRLLSIAIAIAAVFVSCVLCCLLIKGAIGMGDVKLFCIMAFFLGLEGIWSAIFGSLIASFFISVFSLVTKRVKRKDNIPFAPAILIGTYLSFFLTGI